MRKITVSTKSTKAVIRLAPAILQISYSSTKELTNMFGSPDTLLACLRRFSPLLNQPFKKIVVFQLAQPHRLS
jgi:hypothetical protein